MQILGVVRYVRNADRQSCEFVLTVADEWENMRIGRQLMHRLMTVARERGIEIMEGKVLANNAGMLKRCGRLDFRITHDPQDPGVVRIRRLL